MEMLTVLLALFIYRVIIVQSQITIPFTSWSCNAQNTPEPLSIGFLKTENTDSLTSNKTKLNYNLNNSNYKKSPNIPTQVQTNERLLKLPGGGHSKHAVDKTPLFSPTKPAKDLSSIPNSVTSQNYQSIQNLNPKDKFTPQVSSLPLIELPKLDNNNPSSTKYSDINYRDPTDMEAPLNKLRPPSYTENLSTNKHLIPINPYTVSKATNKSTANSDLSRSKEYFCDCNVKTKPYVPLTSSDVKTIETPKSHTLYPHWLTDENRNKIHSDTSPLNLKENPYTTTPKMLADTVIPNAQNFYAHKDINNAKVNNVPASIRGTVNGGANCAPVYSYDDNTERMSYVPIPAVIPSDVRNIEIPNYKTITPRFSFQDGYISKQQCGTSPGTIMKENLVPISPIILDNGVRSKVENLFENKDINSAKLNYESSVTLPTSILTINDDLNCVKAYILQSKPTLKGVAEVKKNEMSKPQTLTSQLSLSNIKKDKTPLVMSAKLVTDMKENLISVLPNILADGTIKALKIATPILNNKGVYVASNFNNNNIQNVSSKIANLSPITEKIKESSTAKFSKPSKNMSKVIIPNIQMNVMPIINNNMTPVTQLNHKSYELQNEKSNENSAQYLQIPNVSNIPITLSVSSKLSEINSDLHKSNEPYITLNTVSIPETTSTYIVPVSVPSDPTVYKTWSDMYTNSLKNSLNQFVSVLTSNILSAFKDNFDPHKTMDTFTKPLTESNDIQTSMIIQTPNSLNLPVFSLRPPLVESPTSLPRPKLKLPIVNTSSVNVSSTSEKINRPTAFSQPYISSITINFSSSKGTTNNIIIVI